MWSEPRSLCATHKADLELADGQPLAAALARVRPANGPLEGSLLGWIFNPVFFRIGHDRARAWADFIGGGMAVFEDRFFARNHFEYWALESPPAVDLLYALKSLPATQDASTLDTLLAAAKFETTMPTTARQSWRGAMEGWSGVVRAWNFQANLKQAREASGRQWPESFDELMAWTKSVPEPSPPPETETRLRRELQVLAMRRFASP